MKPKLSLVGLNRLRLAIALMSGAIAVGISALGRSVRSGSPLVDGTLLTALWIYIGITAVPWASLKGMSGAGVMPALTMAAFSAYLTAATAFAGWSVAENPTWHQARRAAPVSRCVPAPEAAPAAPLANRPSPPSAPPAAPPPAPTPEAAAPAPSPAPAAVADASAPGDASVEEPDGRRHRSHRHRSGEPESGDSRPPPSVWLERDPAGSSRAEGSTAR